MRFVWFCFCARNWDPNSTFEPIVNACFALVCVHASAKHISGESGPVCKPELEEANLLIVVGCGKVQGCSGLLCGSGHCLAAVYALVVCS